MKVLLSWLREFVDVDATGEEIGAKLSLRGFALEGIERLPDGEEVLDFDVTSNRPDCMNVVGLAREVATAYGHSLNRRPGLTPPAGLRGVRLQADQAPAKAGPHEFATTSDIAITIDDEELCRCYAGAVADVQVGPSPAWMQARLKASGIRPISNIVDITNYVLLELGQPMHAFDLTKLGGAQIRVRTAKTGERLKTLDGQDRELTSDMLVIADSDKPVAIAGVMGGADSEVADGTKTIVFESAYFNPLSVRRTSRTLGLKTEASMRFERGTDRTLPPVALLRALTLLEDTGAGKGRGIVIAGHPQDLTPRVLSLRRDRIGGFLGAPIPDDDVFRILGSLGFTAEPTAGGWRVTVPARRIDIHREVDLIEELARHYGFDRIPSHFPPLSVPPGAIDPRITRARQLRAVMTGAGFSEAVTFGFMAAAAAAPFAANRDLVGITNPLSENYGVLRPSALPGLLDAVAHNRRRQQTDVRLFEIGNRFTRTGGESRAIAAIWTGTAAGTHWAGGTRTVDFFDVNGLAERICDALGVSVRADTTDEPWLMAGRAAALFAGTSRVGVLGQLKAAVTEAHGVPSQDAVFALEIELDTLERLPQQPRLQVEPLPRYPSVTRDISILVSDTLPSVTVRDTIRGAAPSTLIGVSEFDRYQGKGVPDGQVSLSLRLTFRSPERTLTDADVQRAMEVVVAALQEAHSAVQR